MSKTKGNSGKKVFRDPRGYAYLFSRRMRLNFLAFVSTFSVKIRMWLKGVHYGKKIRFFGTARFVRHPLSEIRIGDHCVFRSDSTSNLVGVNRKCLISTLRHGAEVLIGDNCGFSGTVIGAAESIKIGNNVLFGANTLLTDFDWHNIAPELRRVACNTSKPVEIGDNVWLGINTIVLKGVKIGENTVIGANSLVVKDIPANVIAAGNPCKVIRNL